MPKRYTNVWQSFETWTGQANRKIVIDRLAVPGGWIVTVNGKSLIYVPDAKGVWKRVRKREPKGGE